MNYYIETTDERNRQLLRLLTEAGYSAFSMECISHPNESSTLVFSPARRLSDEEIEGLTDGVTLFGANLSIASENRLKQKNIRRINPMLSPKFVLSNADLTAEGVLGILIQKTPTSIFESKILILGNGRCAQSIARLLDRLSLSYRIACRKCGSQPYDYIEIPSRLSEELPHFDVIINTIPAKIIGDVELNSIKENAKVIEVASLPCLSEGGAHFEYIKAPALPSVYSPLSAARLLFLELIAE